MSTQPAVTIIGAGPTGALLAILLRRRGLRVVVYESRPDPRLVAAESGRSINLALADRGIHALREIGVHEQLRSALVPMRGRMIHDAAGGTEFQPYGTRAEELNFSVSRQRLGIALLDIAAHRHGVELKFDHRLEKVDFSAGVAAVRDLGTDRLIAVPMQPLLGCDGAGSVLRRELAAARLIVAEEHDLAHGYKELSIPAGPGGEYRLEREALHIWPRGNFMLIALPNTDGSFTATLFLPKQGTVSFAALNGREAIERFLQSNFRDAAALMPDRIDEFESHPTGFLGTVYAAPWHARGAAALIGDAAHAIVPFHGQGMNCCFEDCLQFEQCLARHESWEARFAQFYAKRKRNTDAIAAMALENYREMREQVADPAFVLQRSLALELERRHPQRFIPRYSMVMFHHEIPYRIAQDRGAVQAAMLEDLTRGVTTLGEVDFGRAARLVEERLPPLDQLRSSVTNE